MALYGPTLFLEIRAAGLGPFNITITPDAILGWDDLTEEQQDDLQVVLDAHDPNAQLPRQLAKEAFLLKLVDLGKYADFVTWKAAQPPAVQIKFDVRNHFAEDEEHVEDAAIALSITINDIFAPGT